MVRNNRKLPKKLYACVMMIVLILASLVALMPWVGDVGSANEQSNESFALWIHFFGKFHPLFLHLPIGGLVLVLMM